MSQARYVVGDVFDVMATMPDASVDLILTSPPFLALRSYLPADHPDKAKEIGSEPTPAAFLDTLLHLTAEWRRLLAPHGSICVELGDTYSGAGGYGSPDSPNPAYGAARFDERWEGRTRKRYKTKDDGWPLAKSLCGIPHLYHLSLAYGRNLLTGEPSPAGQWRVRNVVAWCRPNPPVGALGDKFRPGTSYMTVACVSDRRYFDLDAVRVPYDGAPPVGGSAPMQPTDGTASSRQGVQRGRVAPVSNPAGAPPLDWWAIPTQPYAGAHYATFPSALCERPIKAMCPTRVCTVCGEPSRRIVGEPSYERTDSDRVPPRLAMTDGGRVAEGVNQHTQHNGANTSVIRQAPTLGWSDCGHDAWRNGHTLDPFAGSGTTLAVATGHGRDATGIDLDPRNAELAVDRIGGLFLTVEAPGWVA